MVLSLSDTGRMNNIYSLSNVECKSLSEFKISIYSTLSSSSCLRNNILRARLTCTLNYLMLFSSTFCYRAFFSAFSRNSLPSLIISFEHSCFLPISTRAWPLKLETWMQYSPYLLQFLHISTIYSCMSWWRKNLITFWKFAIRSLNHGSFMSSWICSFDYFCVRFSKVFCARLIDSCASSGSCVSLIDPSASLKQSMARALTPFDKSSSGFWRLFFNHAYFSASFFLS